MQLSPTRLLTIAIASLLCLATSACGVRRPLIKPSEIPAFEEQQRKKRENIAKETIEFQKEDAAIAADAKQEVNH